MDRIPAEYCGLVLATVATAVGAAVSFTWVAKAARANRRPTGAAAGVRFGPPLRGGLAAVTTALLLMGFAHQVGVLYRTPVPDGATAPFTEIDQTPEWRAWRAAVHAKLAATPVTDQSLAAALRIPVPALPSSASEADTLRRDQILAEVLLSYEDVRKVLATRFGIRKEFLGTGLSKPLGPTPYAAASVHEYLVDNHRDNHDHVWLWLLSPVDRRFSQPIKTLIGEGGGPQATPEKEPKPGNRFEDDLAEIQRRVQNKEYPFPPMVRFARFDKRYYKNTLGRPEALRVFTSNLSEVWELTIQQAAEKSGYTYIDGDTFFVWVYVPYGPDEFTPATWREVFAHMPEWLENGRR